MSFFENRRLATRKGFHDLGIKSVGPLRGSIVEHVSAEEAVVRGKILIYARREEVFACRLLGRKTEDAGIP